MEPDHIVLEDRINLTELEAADYLRLAPKTLRNWRAAGDGPGFVYAGRRILYRVHDLDSWLSKHRTR